MHSFGNVISFFLISILNPLICFCCYDNHIVVGVVVIAVGWVVIASLRLVVCHEIMNFNWLVGRVFSVAGRDEYVISIMNIHEIVRQPLIV